MACALLLPSSLQAKPDHPSIIVLGDSLTAGYELDSRDAFPVQLQNVLASAGVKAEVANAGVSGDTSKGGLERLEWSVPATADLVIVELGANDALRGIDPAETRRNLDEILRILTGRHQRVLLAGMLAPPNMGSEYAKAFDGLYPALATKYHVPLYPFFLKGVAAQEGVRLPDGMHPNAKGVRLMAEGIAPMVRDILDGK